MIVGLALSGCPRERPLPDPPPTTLKRDLALTDAQAGYLDGLAAAADADPGEFAKRKASGMAHLRFTLSGVLSLRDRAEADLEAAFALDPSDTQLTRTLGRFYNLRGVAGDDSKAEMQETVYRALLHDAAPDTLATGAFVAWSFSRLGTILSHRNRGQKIKAYGVVKALERELDARARANPDNTELWALAGNFAFFFAGNIPLQRKDRVEAAVAYFKHVRERWADMRDGARDPDDCPNTYENFMFELAEGHLVLGEVAEARAIYNELATVKAPVTRAKEQIAFVSVERAKNADAYVGDFELMPPWPSDVGNCVVCHAYTADVPLTTLKVATPITLDDIPTTAVHKPIALTGPVPEGVRAVIDQRCRPCHFAGGDAQPLADFATGEGILARGRAVVRRVLADEMPPGTPLPEEERALLRQWLAE